MRKSVVLLVIIVVLGAGVAWYLWGRVGEPEKVQVVENNPKAAQQDMQVGGKNLKVEVRDDAAERALGLSYRKKLDENEGMLFIFEQPAMHGFWMKGMEFNLDIIWIRNGVIVDISKNVPAPKMNGGQIAAVSPKEAADWVLEVVGGWAEKYEVGVGDEVVLID